MLYENMGDNGKWFPMPWVRKRPGKSRSTLITSKRQSENIQT